MGVETGARECWLLIDCNGEPLHNPPLTDEPRITGREKAANRAAWLNRMGRIGSPFRVLRVRYPWPLPSMPEPAADAPGPPYDWTEPSLEDPA